MSERDAKTELLKKIGQLWGETKQADYYKDRLLASTNYLAYNIDTLVVSEEVLKVLDVCVNKLDYAVEICKKVAESVEKISP
jgi:hypothetical protein